MIAIVTETLSCMNPVDCVAYSVSLAPLDCILEDRILQDRILTPDDSYAVGYSAPPSEETYRTLFADLLETHDGVISITASRRFSDSNRHAQKAAMAFGGRVMVLDSGSVAGGLFLMAQRARHLVSLGYPFSRIKAELESYKNFLRVSFTADTTQILQNAHRISYKMPPLDRPIRSEHPVFRIERGGIGVSNFAAGDHGIADELLDVLIPPALSRRRSPSHVMVHYDERTELLEYLLDRIRVLYPSATVYERPITFSLQLNLGHDIVGLIAD